MIKQRRIAAGPEPEKIFFNKMAAYVIAYPCICQKKYHPNPAFYFKIERSEYYQKKIKRHPQSWLTNEGEKNIKK